MKETNEYFITYRMQAIGFVGHDSDQRTAIMRGLSGKLALEILIEQMEEKGKTRLILLDIHRI